MNEKEFIQKLTNLLQQYLDENNRGVTFIRIDYNFTNKKHSVANLTIESQSQTYL